MVDYLMSLFFMPILKAIEIKEKENPQVEIKNKEEKHWLDEQLEKRPIYIQHMNRKTSYYRLYGYCPDCDKVQALATNGTCFVCGSKQIMVRMGNSPWLSKKEEAV